jgi:isoleucyl-tRNA synthetase
VYGLVETAVSAAVGDAGDEVPPEVAQTLGGAVLAVWTTTPWTMPANMAIAVNATMQYSVVRTQVITLFL